MVYDSVRRIADFLLAGSLLLALSPVLAITLILVRLESPGPPLFHQVRLGRRGAAFTLLKVRTMYSHRGDIAAAEEAILQGEADPRITRIGRFLRKWSIDELPQLWNVVRGDMSLIGPRPVIPEQLPAIPAAARSRFDVRPGLTGLAQVRGRQGLDWPQKLKLDVQYVRDRGPVLDLTIFLETFRVLMSGAGTYYDHPEANWRAYVDPSSNEDSPDHGLGAR